MPCTLALIRNGVRATALAQSSPRHELRGSGEPPVGALSLGDAAAQSHPIEALSPALCPPARLGLQDSSLSTPLVYVASGPHEVSLWDVEQSKCHQVRVWRCMHLPAVMIRTNKALATM